jgi:hypothetical protein
VKTELPTGSVGIEQLRVPVPPIGGDVHDQAPGKARPLKVVPGGRTSESDTDAALLGPGLVTVIV